MRLCSFCWNSLIVFSYESTCVFFCWLGVGRKMVKSSYSKSCSYWILSFLERLFFTQHWKRTLFSLIFIPDVSQALHRHLWPLAPRAAMQFYKSYYNQCMLEVLLSLGPYQCSLWPMQNHSNQQYTRLCWQKHRHSHQIVSTPEIWSLLAQALKFCWFPSTYLLLFSIPHLDTLHLSRSMEMAHDLCIQAEFLTLFLCRKHFCN